MNKSFTTEENGQTINNIFPEETVSLFADGFGPAMIGFPNTKVTLFQQTINPPNFDEIERTIVATITVPTIALIELAAHVQKVLGQNKEQLSADVTSQLNKILGVA